jgi:hypothetical protein
MQTARTLIAKKIPNGYSSPTAMCWAVVEPGMYGDFVLESGFSTKRDALAWIARRLAA